MPFAALSFIVVVAAEANFAYRGTEVAWSSLGQKLAAPKRWLQQRGSELVEQRPAFHRDVRADARSSHTELHLQEKLEASNREMLRRVLTLIDEHSDTWSPVVTTGRTRVWQLKESETSERHACILAKGVLDADPHRVYQLFAEAKRAKDFNEYCDQCVDIARLNHDTKVSWSATKPFGHGLFKPRDFVTLCHYTNLQDGSKCVLNRATTHSAKPENPKYQRAEVVLAVNIVKPHGRAQTHLTLLTQINPRGAIDTSIGARIANQLVKRSPVAYFAAVEKAAQKSHT